ncbi:MAG TPA: hypothetical protein PKL84_13345 [Candidatus Hydrogenedentes bacterium]|nr:hypothetical protein [Candidatus Hydrogenedentota bacterium]
MPTDLETAAREPQSGCFPLPRRWWSRLLLCLLLLYMASYAVMSLSGEYVFNNHGGADWREEWCPRYLVYPYRAPTGRTRIAVSRLGMAYLPLIILDWLLWHKTVWEADTLY